MIAALGVGGVVYYLARSGRLPMQEGAAQRTEAVVVAITTHAMVLEPLLVNLCGCWRQLLPAGGLDPASSGSRSTKEALQAKDEKSKVRRGQMTQ